MSDLTIDAVTVRYGDRTAVADVSLDVPAGTTLAVLGPSGCGKSSLLRAVAGLEQLSGGRIVLAGRDLAGVPTYRRGVGLMFQEHALFAHLDVAGNVAFGLRMQGVARPEREVRVAEMLDLVDLAGRGGDRIDELSGGERQRVALARTLAPRPAVVMFDEPLGSLDRALRRDLVDVLDTAFTATGATVLYVTHDQTEAFALADRIAVMRAGRVVQIDTPLRLRDEPADAWVVDFLR